MQEENKMSKLLKEKSNFPACLGLSKKALLMLFGFIFHRFRMRRKFDDKKLLYDERDKKKTSNLTKLCFFVHA